MFKDAEEALKRLEAELLAEEEEEIEEEDFDEEYEDEELLEETDEDLLSEEELDILLDDTRAYGSAVTYQNHANHYGNRGKTPRIYNTDNVEEDLNALSDQLLEEKRSGRIGGLVALACILALGIVGVAIWWLSRYWGLF